MKHIIYWVLLAMSLSVSFAVCADNHTAVSEQIMKYPRTVLNEAGCAVRLARSSGNSSQFIDALMQLSAARLHIDSDSITVVVAELDEALKGCDNPVERSVIALYMSALYDYYHSCDYEVYGRPYIVGNDDIMTWSSGNYDDKIDELRHIALQPARELKATPISQYRALIHYEGYDDEMLWSLIERFFPTMYDFMLMQYASDIDEAVFDDMIAFHATRDEQAALFMWQLMRIVSRADVTAQEGIAGTIAALDALIEQYGEYEYVIEAVVQKYNYEEMVLRNDDATAVRRLYDDAKGWIARYPHYYMIDVLRNRCRQWSAAVVNVNMPAVCYENTPITVEVKYSNAASLRYRLERYEDVAYDNLHSLHTLKSSLLADSVLTLNDNAEVTFESKKTDFVLPPLPAGAYCLKMQAGEVDKTIRFIVTPYMMYVVSLTSHEAIVVLVDNKSGQPVAGESISLYSEEGEMIRNMKTDADGVCRIKRKKEHASYDVALTDISRCPYTLPVDFMWEGVTEDGMEVRLFTDRSVYRPGQELHFSALVYCLDSEVQKLMPGKTVQVTLYDSGRNEVWHNELVTDSYGSISGSITLPEEAAMGSWSLWATVDGSNYSRNFCSLTVAEYKLPQFAISCNPIEGTFAYGDTVYVSGKVASYSGVAMAGADVKYRVTRSSWRWGMREELVSGSLTTDGKGDFTLRFVAQEPQDAQWRRWGTMYVVDITATSLTGESQELQLVVTVAGNAVMITFNSDDLLCREEAGPIEITMTNSEGTALRLPMSVEVYALAPVDGKPETMQRADTALWQHDYPAGDSRVALPYSDMASGAYRLVVTTHDLSGCIVCDSTDVILYSRTDAAPPVPVAIWSPVVSQEVTNGEKASFVVGSSYEQASLLYIVKSDDKVVALHRLALNNSNTTITIPYKASYGDAVSIELLLVRDNRLYGKQLELIRKQPDKRLTIIPATFRDHTVAGGSEKWQFTVRDAKGKPVNALFMAEMYDASLDALMRHRWQFDATYIPQVPYLDTRGYWEHNRTKSSWWNYYTEFQGVNSSVTTVHPYLYDYLTPYNTYDGMVCMSVAEVRSNGAVMKQSAMTYGEYAEEVAVADALYAEEEVMSEEEVASAQAENKPIHYRENMTETAFFYPHLVTDKQGNVVIEFTLPEVNTTWNFLSLAVTPDLSYGKYNATVITNKPLMVSPNVPRFLRHGDTTCLSVAVQNTTPEALSGEVFVELYMLENDSTIVSVTRPFTALAEGSAIVNIEIDVPENITMIGMRVGATTPLYSDGEQHLIPILPASQLVTEAHPFYISPAVTDTTILFADMQERMKSDTVNSFRLTLEYCDNPAWYAVTALPSLAEPHSTSATAYMASLYTNTVAAGIVSGNSTIARAIATWSETQDSVALTSLLMQNEELKQIILSQTPWALEATSATEQLQQIATLLDAERAGKLRHKAVEELRLMQGADGGWSWFKDMPSSFWITLDITHGLSRLAQWGECTDSEDITSMQHRALQYLDTQYLQRNASDTAVGYYDICYLYVRSKYHDVPMSDTLHTLRKAQLESLSHTWYNLSEIEKAYAAIALYRYGNERAASDIVNSLREYAVTTPSQGMYWPHVRSHTYYTNSAIQVHCAIYEAFALISPQVAEQDAMRQWLLMQKQTQAWGSVPSTLDAINILLTTGSNWLGSGVNTHLQWGETTLPQASQSEPIMGYNKYVRDAEEITASDAEVTLTGHDAQPAWGALYWQYYDKVTHIEEQGSADITLSRSYYVEREGELVPIDSTTLCVGDVVTVYLRIYTSRDMQYMTLVDTRAACFEPVSPLPHYDYSSGIGYYCVPGDATTQFYIDHLTRGTHVLTYKVYADRVGCYQVGVATLQSYYAPQYTAHTSGQVVSVTP